MWSAVQSQLPAVAAKGLSIVAKVIIGLSSAAVVSTVALIALNSNSDEKKEPKQVPVELSSNNPIDNQEIKEKEIKPTTSTDPKELNLSTNNEASTQTYPNQENDMNQGEDRLIEWPIKVDQERLTQEDKLIPDPKKETIAEATNHETVGSPEKGTESKKNEQKEEETPTTTLESNLPEIQKLVLPDIFTPNGDMRNDELFVVSEGLKDFSMVVLNAQNQVVFKTNEPDFRWNGYDLFGSPLPDGDYMYMVTALDEYNRPVNASSRLRIAR